MAIETKIGDPLMIQLQLYDGLASMPKRVFVDLSVPNGTLIEPRFEIAHVIGGDFRNEVRVMPNEDYVTAQYFVYENDGVTLDEDYIINKDIFVKTTCDLTSSIVLGGEISGEVELESTLSGEVDLTELDGTIETESELVGTIDETTLEGVIDDC